MLLVWSGYVHSPTHLEVFHLPAGLSHWELSRYDLFRVNPPLVRMVAALPVYLVQHESNYNEYSTDPFYRAEYGVGLDTMHANGSRFIWLMTLARWACIPFILLGGYICFRWARELYGDTAGIIALLLWCFCPYVLGQGSVITPDAHAAALGITAAYCFWKWLRTPTWKLAILAGIILGIAELSKFTLLIFYPLGFVMWVVFCVTNKRLLSRSIVFEAFQGFVIVALSILVINYGYDFENTIKPLGEYRFQTRTLTGIKSLDDIPKSGANRFMGTVMENIPVPLPANFVGGLDLQKKDFETGIFSYLNGKWQIGGWWYFHIFAMIIKIPLGTWGLICIAASMAFWGRKYHSMWTNELFLLLPVVSLLVVLSTQSGVSVHSRYCMPLLPFLFIWTGKVGMVVKNGTGYMRGFIFLLLAWSVCSTLYYFPHEIAYCNELVGGPKNAYKHLAKSDSSWGQDLLLLKNWLDKHPEVKELRLAHCGPFDPRLAGIEFTLPPVAPNGQERAKELPPESLGPQPGWYAIDVCFLLGGDPLSAANGKGDWDEPSKTQGYDLSYFQSYTPVALIGYTIYIYHIPDDKNAEQQK
ncbi:MAG: ArnT family glycosyltransferase [Thermoguttaceae bacterium]